MNEMQVVYACEQPPSHFSKSIFLAGPSPRDPAHPNWRPMALKVLEDMGYDGVVFVPIPRIRGLSHGYDAQIDWENAHLNMADAVVFWVPRSKDLPALTTNIEFGMFYDSGKAILGYPEDATQMRYLVHQAKLEHVPVHTNLEDTLRAAVERIGNGAERMGGERMVPLHIWKLPHFQGWMKAQKSAGNRLDGARLLWSFRVGPTKGFTLAFTMHVDVHIASENRNKTNEFVVARPDTATIIAYRKREKLTDTEIVLVREFRSTSSTSDGFIREAPGGSSFKPNQDVFVTAATELKEETGFDVDPSRLRKVGARQPCGTLSVHQAHAFACELTEEELANLRQQQLEGKAHGNISETERTYVEVHRLGDLIAPPSNAVDWSMIGMIMAAVQS